MEQFAIRFKLPETAAEFAKIFNKARDAEAGLELNPTKSPVVVDTPPPSVATPTPPPQPSMSVGKPVQLMKKTKPKTNWQVLTADFVSRKKKKFSFGDSQKAAPAPGAFSFGTGEA